MGLHTLSAPMELQGFHYVLLSQLVYFSIGAIIAVSVERARDGILEAGGMIAEIGVGLFVLGCIALRLALHFRSCPFTGLVLLGMYTSGITLIGCELAVQLQADYPQQLADTGPHGYKADERLQGQYQGQMAVCLGCGVLILTYLLVQSNALVLWSHLCTAWAPPPPPAATPLLSYNDELRISAIQSSLLVLLLSGLCVITIDDREWDWRYALMVFIVVIISVYLNVFSTWLARQPLKEEAPHHEEEAYRSPWSASVDYAFHKASLLVLQPILFAENWVLLCLTA
jgi:hypothetical protein